MSGDTKERILETALELFAQSGYLGTSMSDIAKQLGITKGALYKHYKSKQEILDCIVERMNQMDYERAEEYEMPENMAAIFRKLADSDETAMQLALEFYGPMYLLYSVYDGAEDKESIAPLLDTHINRFIAKVESIYRKDGNAT